MIKTSRHLVALTSVGAVVASLLVAATATTASGSANSNYLVTFAARYCHSYTDVTANRARNNLMESLKDLGVDTPYVGSDPVSASVEDAVQPNCHPLVGWHFTLGQGIAGQVTGTWGALSVVSNPFAQSITTAATTPLLDNHGDPTGGTLRGATTVRLTDNQLQLAANHRLWVQGGLVNDPVEDVAHPGGYGFAALRCALDNVNGDNVEWIGFPASEQHVFCFAYYVTPPPTSGTIIVTKAVPQGVTETQEFPFTGNLSFNPGGAFTLGVVDGNPASETFIRGASATPWTVAEDIPVNWRLQDVTCTSEGDSTFTYPTNGASITLAAGDTVHCTFTDAPIPPTQLTIRKISLGGIGTFPFTVTGGNAPVTVSATTTEPRVAVDATPTSISAPGTYTITEHPPAVNGGAWTVKGAECDGVNEPVTNNSITVTVTEGTEPVCTFTDLFVPFGKIVIAKVMTGSLGTVFFRVNAASHPEVNLLQSATPNEVGVPSLATGDDTRHLPLGRYYVTELVPKGANPAGWSILRVTCGGREVGLTGSTITVVLTLREPVASCVFTNAYRDPGTTTTIPTPVTRPPINVTG